MQSPLKKDTIWFHLVKVDLYEKLNHPQIFPEWRPLHVIHFIWKRGEIISRFQ